MYVERGHYVIRGLLTSINKMPASYHQGPVRSERFVNEERQQQQQQQAEDSRYFLLQYALYNLREFIDKLQASESLPSSDTSTLRDSIRLVETLRNCDSRFEMRSDARSWKDKKRAPSLHNSHHEPKGSDRTSRRCVIC